MLIMPHPYGRMANRLLLSASCIAQAEEQGDSFLHLAFADYFRYFEGTRRSPFLFYRSSNPSRHSRSNWIHTVNIWKTYDRADTAFDLETPTFTELENITRYLILIGWSFRARQAVTKHRDLIRSIFTPVRKHRDAVAALINSARKQTSNLVGVHIRQTDYKNFANGRYFYPLSIYRNAIKNIEQQLPGNTRFLLCSDAPVDLSQFKDLNTVLSTNHPLEDNYALAACDLIVGPPSTYTHWASYYGGTPLGIIKSEHDTMHISDFKTKLTL